MSAERSQLSFSRSKSGVLNRLQSLQSFTSNDSPSSQGPSQAFVWCAHTRVSQQICHSQSCSAEPVPVCRDSGAYPASAKEYELEREVGRGASGTVRLYAEQCTKVFSRRARQLPIRCRSGSGGVKAPRSRLRSSCWTWTASTATW